MIAMTLRVSMLICLRLQKNLIKNNENSEFVILNRHQNWILCRITIESSLPSRRTMMIVAFRFQKKRKERKLVNNRPQMLSLNLCYLNRESSVPVWGNQKILQAAKSLKHKKSNMNVRNKSTLSTILSYLTDQCRQLWSEVESSCPKSSIKIRRVI